MQWSHSRCAFLYRLIPYIHTSLPHVCLFPRGILTVGQVAVLMNNAGIAPKGTSWGGIENWKNVFDVNLFGCVFLFFRCSREATDQSTFSIVNVQQTFIPVSVFACATSPCQVLTRTQSMLHQENAAMVINTGSKQGITNPPCVPSWSGVHCCLTSLVYLL